MKFCNSKGASLIGVMITAAIGLVITLGISKALLNFADQTTKLNRENDISIIKQNITSKLRDYDIWKNSMIKENGGETNITKQNKVLGQNRPIKLLDGNSVIMCRRKKGSNAQGVMIISKDGLPQTLKCDKCSKQDYCGFNKAKVSRIVLDAVPNERNIPGFTGQIEDTAGTKKAIPIDTTAVSEELYAEQQASCEVGKFLVRIDNGVPVCRDYDEGMKNKRCGVNQVLIGFNANGDPMCQDIRGYTNVLAPEIAKNRGACPLGQYLQGFDNNGNRICISRGTCPNGQYLQGFDGNSRPICRRINFLGMGGNCGSNQVAYGVDSFGKPRCRPLTVRKSHYSHACDKCNRTTNLGTHFFCSLAGFGSGGWNADCQVMPRGNGWVFTIVDHDNNDQTTGCKAVCIDFN